MQCNAMQCNVMETCNSDTLSAKASLIKLDTPIKEQPLQILSRFQEWRRPPLILIYQQVLQVSRRLDPWHHQHRRQLHLSRVSLRHPHQRRPGNWRRVDESVHVAVRCPRHVRPGHEPGQNLHAEEAKRGEAGNKALQLIFGVVELTTKLTSLSLELWSLQGAVQQGQFCTMEENQLET